MGSTDELFAAIDAGDAELMRSTLLAEPTLASARDAQGVSALMRARYRSLPQLVDAVLAADPAIDVFEAAVLGDVERLRTLLDGDATLATAFSGDGFSALHLPAFFGGIDAARLLVDRGADVDAHGRGWMTGTPLNAAAAGRHTDVARLLLDAGAEADARQASGWTPLHSAAHNGNLELVELLLAHGADPSATNDDAASVLSSAEDAGHPDVVARVRSALGP